MKRVIAFISSLNLVFVSSAQATIYLSDYPHLSQLKSRAEGNFPASVTQEIWAGAYEYEPDRLIASFELPLINIYAFCGGDFGSGYFAAEYKGDFNYFTRQHNTGTGRVFRRVYLLPYDRESDEFDTSNLLNGYLTPISSPLPDEFVPSRLQFYGSSSPGGTYCFGFKLLIDYFDSSSFENRPTLLPILPLSRPKSGCYALVVSPFGTASSSDSTKLKQEVYNFSSSFVADKDVSVPDNSGLTNRDLIYETQDEYDKAYFAAQWVNPQCKWLPSHFRHKANFWGDLSNFFSSLFF
jgi:hypothetical protein